MPAHLACSTLPFPITKITSKLLPHRIWSLQKIRKSTKGDTYPRGTSKLSQNWFCMKNCSLLAACSARKIASGSKRENLRKCKLLVPPSTLFWIITLKNPPDFPPLTPLYVKNPRHVSFLPDLHLLKYAKTYICWLLLTSIKKLTYNHVQLLDLSRKNGYI